MLYEMDIFIDRHCDRGDGWSHADVSAADQPLTASGAGRGLLKSLYAGPFFFLAD